MHSWRQEEDLLSLRFDGISPRTVRSKLKLLNQRPMKCLEFNTPNEIFFRRKTLDSKKVSLST